MTTEGPGAVSAIASTPKSADAWFARLHPPGHASNAMTPVHWLGWVAVAAFCAAVFLGGLSFLLFGLTGGVFLGFVSFLVIAGGAGFALLKAVELKGDHKRVVPEQAAAQTPNASSATETTSTTSAG